ncbi:flavodoxin [Oribacterium sp. FC2011]|uniref:flavodoxin n=1 Tax=Oribacterium sp. FC2011 TaxID=1408311 RepID=UPI0004E1C444|nr:flavodoxin [Oribacterium sp. FC2011]
MGKSLVAFFSASGVTKQVAVRLASSIGAELFEIEPEEKYTSADLNWQDKSSRSSIEMNDKNSRPEIASRIADISEYSNVFVGFPVWWYREPSIIDTFMESYNFSGKTVIPFCTSGGSGIGNSGENMKALAKEANVVSGRRFTRNVSEEELKKWVEEII